jgi:DMSO/TMAO reductase YedYZ molybdopterin-dependent catalytic subunit
MISRRESAGPVMKRRYNPTHADHRTGRRNFLARLAALPAAFRARGIGYGAQQPPITSPNAPFSRAFNFASLKQWITPTPEFFVRSHFGIPKLPGAQWAVKVTGAVERERVFTLDELMKMPATEEVVTLECAGNLVGWGGVSNARWAGVRLSDLLKASGPSASAIEVVLAGADGGAEREAGGIQVDEFARSIPLAKALDAGTILAYEMNGEPLPAIHGGPLRAIVPGWYGMDCVKWVKQIIVAREPFAGFYQRERYYEARRAGVRVERYPLEAMRLKSQIARPINEEVLPLKATTVTGAAWCGEAEVARVELSFDGGRAWKEARLGDERSLFAWRLWSYDWTPPARGTYEIVARAHDAKGRAQPLERDPQIITPYANNWADRRTVNVR